MSKPNYRVILTYDADRKVWLARAPELEHCAAEGSTRAEAIGRVEEEIDAQLANMLSHGTTPPRSVDEETFSGELAIKVSKGLHRDLAYQARAEGIDLDHLMSELLGAAMESRRATHRGQPRGGNRPASVEHDNIGNRHDAGGQRRGGFGGGGRNSNYQLLDDRANFIEYVRGLEQGGGHGGPGHHGGRGPGGPGGGGPGGGGDRRRRRGGRGGGPGNFRPNNMQGQGYGNGNGSNGPRNGNAPQPASGQPAAASAPPSSPSSMMDGAPQVSGGHDDGDGNV